MIGRCLAHQNADRRKAWRCTACRALLDLDPYRRPGTPGAARVRKASPWRPGTACVCVETDRLGYTTALTARIVTASAKTARIEVWSLLTQAVVQRRVRLDKLRAAPDPLPETWPQALRPQGESDAPKPAG